MLSFGWEHCHRLVENRVKRHISERTNHKRPSLRNIKTKSFHRIPSAIIIKAQANCCVSAARYGRLKAIFGYTERYTHTFTHTSTHQHTNEQPLECYSALLLFSKINSLKSLACYIKFYSKLIFHWRIT